MPNFSLAGSDKNAPHSQEHRFTSPSGIESHVLIEVSIVERNHGDEIGLCLRLRDRTALRNALDKSEEHFALFETLDLAMGKGQGSTFTFMLPPQERSRPSLKKIGFSASPTRFANRDVLIVDDEAPIRAILQGTSLSPDLMFTLLQMENRRLLQWKKLDRHCTS